MSQRVLCVLSPRAPFVEFAEACLRFTPQIAIREGEAIYLEIGGSLNLFREETILTRVGLLAQRFGFVPQLGVANDVPTALAMARHGCKRREMLPLAALLDYASPFERNADAETRARRLVEVLQMLGMRTLEDFARLPPKTITSRFGAHGLDISMRVYKSFLDELDMVWPRFRLAESIEEKTQLFDGGMITSCRELEPLLFVIRGLADRLMARLRGRGLRVATLEIEADLEKLSRSQATQVVWTMRLPTPQSSVSGLIPILRERLAGDFQRAPLVAPVTSLRVRVLETAPGHGAQRNLFNSTEEEAEMWDALVGRLTEKMGKDSAFNVMQIDRYVPEESWRPTLEPVDSVDKSVDIPERPARVLKKPKYLEKKGDILSHDERDWEVLEWQGPERISCEWWRDPGHEGFNRDYYRALTNTGEELWVYSVPGKPGFYLHGYFD